MFMVSLAPLIVIPNETNPIISSKIESILEEVSATCNRRIKEPYNLLLNITAFRYFSLKICFAFTFTLWH